MVGQYVEEVKRKMGVEDGDSFRIYHFSGNVQWGRVRGLHRIHYHLSRILDLSMRGSVVESQAYTVQLLKAIAQVSLDNGSWDVANRLLPAQDPLAREAWGGTEKEMETALGYLEALKKLRRQPEKSQDEEKPDKAASGQGGRGTPKKRGRGRAAPPAADGLQ